MIAPHSMRIAIVGATSQIALDLVKTFSRENPTAELLLYVRNAESLRATLATDGISERYPILNYSAYGNAPHNVVINFVGVGDPQRAAEMGAEIYAVTQQYDDLILEDLKKNPSRKYIFLSSGAAYGDAFSEPASHSTPALVRINSLDAHSHYSIAKLHAEGKHRSLSHLSIVDIRVFNYFSRSQDINARFLIADIVRSVVKKEILTVNSDYIVRDYLHPSDFYNLVNYIIAAPKLNIALDCYSAAPISKSDLLDLMRDNFGLRYTINSSSANIVNATGLKSSYFSKNMAAQALGYKPQFTSADGITAETKALLKRLHE